MTAALSLPDEPTEAERRAEALALLRTSILIHDRARIDFDAAVDVLAVALERAVAASEAYTRVGDLVLNATRLLAALRDGR